MHGLEHIFIASGLYIKVVRVPTWYQKGIPNSILP